MIGIIIIIYFTAGFITAWWQLIDSYKEYGEINSDDIIAAFACIILGLPGLLIAVIETVAGWLEDNRPVERFFEFIAGKVTELFDKFRKK